METRKDRTQVIMVLAAVRSQLGPSNPAGYRPGPSLAYCASGEQVCANVLSEKKATETKSKTCFIIVMLDFE